MKRILVGAVLTLALAACAGDSGREFARYYDPQGIFVTKLPAANDLQVIPAQAAQAGLGSILTGVIATPPQPSPSSQVGIGGGIVGTLATPATDQTVYQVRAVASDAFEDLDEMTLSYLTGDPTVDVKVEEAVRIDGDEGRLLVADVTQDGAVAFSILAAFTLGREGTGFIVIAFFPPGGWDSERGDFFRVLESFRAGVPPGLTAFPVTGTAA